MMNVIDGTSFWYISLRQEDTGNCTGTDPKTFENV